MNGQPNYNALPRRSNSLVDQMQLAKIREQIENERRYGAMSQGTRPMTAAENALYAGKELTGVNAINRGIQSVRDFRGQHGIMNPATPKDYAMQNIGMAGNALEATMAGMDIGALSGPAGRMSANAIESAIRANPGLFPDTQAGMVAWHGSPHKFPPSKENPLGEFDLSKMGSGEGVQAFGWGTYLAEGKGTAKSYQEGLGRWEIGGEDAREWLSKQPRSAMDLASKEKIDIGQAAKKFEELSDRQLAVDYALSYGDNAEYMLKQKHPSAAKEYRELVESGKLENKGHLYEVDLPDKEIDKMLDWDKPLSKEEITKLNPLIEQAKKSYPSLRVEGMTGKDFYQAYTGHRGGNQAAASEALNELGIPGIKYYDATSRTAGEGTRNFVVFDPKKAKIVGRN